MALMVSSTRSVRHDGFDFHLGQQIDLVFLPAVNLFVSFCRPWPRTS